MLKQEAKNNIIAQFAIFAVLILGLFVNLGVAYAEENIIVEKNPESISNFIPDKFYELEDNGINFEIKSEGLVSKNGEKNLLAIGMDQSEEDFYTFRVSCNNNDESCESAFQDFISDFRK